MNLKLKILFLNFFLVAFFIGLKAQSPNIVIVYIDDMGYGDVGHQGAIDYITPHFNQLSREGVTFKQFYSPQAVCSASRAGLLTGCYPNRVGFRGAMDHTSKAGLHQEETTIAEMLKVKGYATAVFGKWHLGHREPFLPTQHGFDEYFGIPYSNDMWPNHPVSKNYYPPLPLYENEAVIDTNPDQSLFTTWFTEHTIDFIQRHKDEPFFVYLAHPMPHVPLFVSDKFAGKSKQGLFGDVMMELDWSIGQVRQALKDLGLEENTLFVVTSDNGPWLNYGNHAGSTGGLREGKGTTFDGGQKVPAMMAWPEVIPPGSISNGLASAIDLLPTIAEATGASLPERKIDGVSLMPLLKNPEGESPRQTFLYYYRQNNLEAVRHGNWKLVLPHWGRTYEGFNPGKDGMPGGANERHNFEGGLYDLRRDPGERYDVRFAFPEVYAQLMAIVEEARNELGDALTGNEGSARRPLGQME
ncbi:MAG: sulfatase [Saprospiraceae bacterium]